MGTYELEEERVNEFPLYKKADEDHYIYRNKEGRTGGGCWMVAEERAHGHDLRVRVQWWWWRWIMVG